MNESPIQKMYKNLPKESKGKYADNPTRFQEFFDPKYTNPSGWRYLLLCQDVSKKNYTWHMACDAYPLDWWKDTGRPFMEHYVSKIRNRVLRFVEVVDRRGNHYFVQ